MKKLARTFGAAAIVLVAMASISSLRAEELKEGESEVGAYIGGHSYGGASFGVNYARAMKPRFLVLGEFGYMTGGGYGLSGYSSHGFEFGGNVHYLFPLKNEKLTPYVLGGVGIEHFSYGYPSGLCGIISCGSASFTTGGVNIGGGLRWTLNEKWGVRPEWKVLIGNHTSSRFAVGVYYHLGK
ncbi:MAG: outer membrane beta-barrel protein [Acidobacteriota bacterium]